MAGRKIAVDAETWPIAGTFTIARGSKTEAEVVTVEIYEGFHVGRGECVPYRHYGETVEGVIATVKGIKGALEGGADRALLERLLPAGAARNAVDCALWDLEAKQTGRRVWDIARLPSPTAVVTAYTISLGTPEAMAEAARNAGRRSLFKLKLGGEGDIERVRAVRAVLPLAHLIVDANEAWTPDFYGAAVPQMQALGIELIEQPFEAGKDEALARLPRPIPICADESCHTRESLQRLRGRYDAVNVKLDKAGGLSEALALARQAESEGFQIMVGCMVSTSLAMAPAMVLAPLARYVDLDGPLLLAKDREPGLRYHDSAVEAPERELWG